MDRVYTMLMGKKCRQTMLYEEKSWCKDLQRKRPSPDIARNYEVDKNDPMIKKKNREK